MMNDFDLDKKLFSFKKVKTSFRNEAYKPKKKRNIKEVFYKINNELDKVLNNSKPNIKDHTQTTK